MKHTVSLKQNRDFRRLYSRGRSAVSPALALYTRPNRTPVNRLGITVSGKLTGAVGRNLLRRRLREIYRTNECRFRPGQDLVVAARARALRTPYAQLQDQFLALADKLHLLVQEGGSQT